MAQGISIHIGLNNIDVAAYGPGNELSGCINDARAMQQIAVSCGFQTTLMTDEQATAGAVVQAISGAASSLQSGDILLLTYSGHGSQVRDTNGDEEDGLDETWCCYDRKLIDDELYQLWAKFKPGVRVFMLSDSCHSGTVARMLINRELASSPAVAAHYRTLSAPGRQAIRPPAAMRAMAAMQPRTPPPATAAARPPVASSVTAVAPAETATKFRLLPTAASERDYEQHKELYATLQNLTLGAKASISATVILISGCQDNQLSADGTTNGLFTQNLLNVWNNGSFSGSHKQFHQQIAAQMPPMQSPNYLVIGAANTDFEAQRPFTVTTDATNQPVAATLWVRGPATLSRSDPAPTFQVNPGPNSYFIFEIATEADLFDTGNNQNRRTDANFYGSWSDSPHQTGISYTLPTAVWDRLKAAPRLYYRIGSTATSTGWMNYMTSTPDQQWQNAPSIELAGGQVGPQPGTAGPTITAPDSMSGSAAPPTFTVDTGGAPYYVVEVATEADLFDTSNHENDRTDANFYGTWQDSALLTGQTYQLPQAVWDRLKSAAQLYYRVGATQDAEWTGYTVSVDDSDWANAPSITIEAARQPPAARATAEVWWS